MNDNNTPASSSSITPQVTSLRNTKAPRGATTPWRRATYSQSAAEKFIELFDAMIVDRESREVSSEVSGYKTNTLYVMANDAMKYLCETLEGTEGDKYRTFRLDVEVKRNGEKGIVIQFRNTMRNAIQGSRAKSFISAAKPITGSPLLNPPAPSTVPPITATEHDPQAHTKVTTEKILLVNTAFRARIMKWIELAQPDIFDEPGITLSADDKHWLQCILAGLNKTNTEVIFGDTQGVKIVI